MTRAEQLDRCEFLLTHLSLRLQARGRLNLLNLHLHSEDLFVRLLNRMYGYQLVNLNAISQNAAGVDLVDTVNKVIVQVTATATKAKLQGTLNKDLPLYPGYRFRFLAIVVDASPLTTSTYQNPNNLVFDPPLDVLDITTLLRVITSMNPADLAAVVEMLTEELDASRVARSPSSLAEVIKAIAAIPVSPSRQSSVRLPYKISDKLTFNQLDKAKRLVQEYRIFSGKIADIYAEFDKAGKFKSTSILETFLLTYSKLSVSMSGDVLFFAIVAEMVAKVLPSPNHVGVSQEDLEFWMTVLAVDAFNRCKIFEPPPVRPKLAVT